MIDREAAYQALADRLEDALESVSLSGVPDSDGWTVTRQLRDFDDPALPQPACVVVATTQTPHYSPMGNVASEELEANAIVYFKNRDPDGVPDALANKVIDAIDDALKATPTEADSAGGVQTTLGGVAVSAKRSGRTQVFQGLPESQTVVVIPITMLVA